MGMPGVGKGTQAARLRDRLGVIHVSTGDLLREAVHNGSPLGRQARSHMEAGDLVPDELMGELIVERLSREDAGSGFVLDGFPRTGEQVLILDRVLERLGAKLDRVVLLGSAEAEVVRRLAGRRVCPRCHAVYHVETKAPRAAGVCDACGSALVQRPDDREEVVLQRLAVYREQTQPVVERYSQRGLLRVVEGNGAPETVASRLDAALGLA